MHLFWHFWTFPKHTVLEAKSLGQRGWTFSRLWYPSNCPPEILSHLYYYYQVSLSSKSYWIWVYLSSSHIISALISPTVRIIMFVKRGEKGGWGHESTINPPRRETLWKPLPNLLYLHWGLVFLCLKEHILPLSSFVWFNLLVLCFKRPSQPENSCFNSSSKS